METGKPSRTAIAAAVARAAHRELDAYPWVLDDPYAGLLIGHARGDQSLMPKSLFTEEMQRRTRGFVAGRLRYTEDRPQQGGFEQYVILGAGLDAFVWRRPDLAARITVFEVDYPASQAWKRERAREIGLTEGTRQVFVPIDFEVETLEAGLGRSGFDRSRRTLFSWVGVTMYLSIAAIEATLRAIARCAPDSEVVLTYCPDRRDLDPLNRKQRELFITTLTAVGEDPSREFAPHDMEMLVARCGLVTAEHPRHDDLMAKYFAGRPDGLVPYQLEPLLAARVGSGSRRSKPRLNFVAR